MSVTSGITPAQILRAREIYAPDGSIAASAANPLASSRETDILASALNSIATDSGDPAQDCCRLGPELLGLRRFEEAIAKFDGGIALNPNRAKSHYGRGVALKGLGHHNHAVRAFETALTLNPGDVATIYNLGQSLLRTGRYSEALEQLFSAATLCPHFAEAHFAISECLLATGHFASGWRAYEWRRNVKSFGHVAAADPTPRWYGTDDIAGKSILLRGEQGFGDIIQFCRYALLLLQRGARVVLEVPQQLTYLLASLGEVDVVSRGAPVPPVDFYAPLLSLPLAFNTDALSIPANVPYLFPDAERTAEFQEKLDPTVPFRVGLVWAGSPTHLNDVNRSISLSSLLPLLKVGNVEFVSLQKELSDRDRQTMQTNAQVKQLGADLRDFADTAALIGLMDLVITVDTAVAHLAGALGKPTWLLLPYAPDWRWLTDGTRSTWYPTMRIFRQAEFGDWQSPLQQVREELSKNIVRGA